MSDFNFYLNRQGVRGKQGEKGDKGDQGFSPYIEIKTNTPSEFIMTVNNENDSFDTPNLIPTAIGDKVMEMDATLTTHTEDIANLKLENHKLNSTVVGIKGSLGTVQAEIEAASLRIDSESYRIGDLEIEINNVAGDVANNSADILEVKNKNTSQDNEISSLKTSKQNKLVEGNNVSLTDNADGTTTISATGSGSSDVTLAGDNTFTGINTFSSDVNFENGLTLKNGDQARQVYLDSAGYTAIGSKAKIGNITIQPEGIIDTFNNVHFLKQNSIIAGDNISITQNSDGTTTIASTDGGGEESYPVNMRNFKVNGALTNNNEVYSGFSTSNYIYVDDSNIKLISTDNNTPIETNISFTTSSDFNSDYTILCNNATGSGLNSLHTTTAGKLAYWDGYKLTVVDKALELNKKYIAKMLTYKSLDSRNAVYVIEDNGFNLETLPDISQWTGTTSNFRLNDTSTYLIGKNNVNQSYPSEIDMNLFNQKMNDIEIWRAVIRENYPVPVATTENVGLVKPDGTSITISQDGTISATGGSSTPDNMVTTNTAQTISGYKTFTGIVRVGDYIDIDTNRSGANQYSAITGSAYVNHFGVKRAGQCWAFNSDPRYATTLDGESGSQLTVYEPYLRKGNITAGDGITIEATRDSRNYITGVKISSTSSGGGGSGDVTLAGDNTFTGKNKFTKTVITGAYSAINLNEEKQELLTSSGETYKRGVDGIFQSTRYDTELIDLNTSETYSPDNMKDVIISATGDLILKANNNTYSENLKTTGTPRIKDGSGNIMLSQGNVMAGDNVTIENTSNGIKISATGGGGSSDTSDEYGIRADYAIRHGIIDNPNGIITYSAANKDITVNQGLVLNCAGNGTAKTTIATAIPYTVTSTGAFTLFYADGNLLECGKVDYSTVEPEDNGVGNYQAWFNPDKTANPNQQWQFKSNDTGNVFRPVNSATPIADFVAGETGITSVSYLGYKVTDDDIFALKSDIPNKETISHISSLSNSYTDLTFGASGTEYVVPEDGLFYLGITPVGTNDFIKLEICSSTGEFLYANRMTRPAAASYLDSCIQVSKGNKLIIRHTISAPTEVRLRFFPNNIQ